MPRSGRNTMQRKCDQIHDGVDHILVHLKSLHDNYTYGQEGVKYTNSPDPPKGETRDLPLYPEQAAAVEQLTAGLIMWQQAMDRFKKELV